MKKIDKKELKKLLIEIKKENTKAFEELYHKYHKLVYGISFSIVKNKPDAEDIVQMIFTKMYLLEKEKLPLKNEASWLYTMTKNETINFLKKKNSTINLEEIYEIEDTNNEIDQIIDKQTYNKLLSGLSKKEKEIVSLKILANLSFDEIANILKMPTGTVKWKYYKSIHTLKILISTLGMFMVTALLGIATLKKQKTSNSPSKPQNTNTTEDDTAKKEETNQTPPVKEDTNRTEGSILENTNSQTRENVIEVPITESKNANDIGIAFIAVSAIFFIITIIFSIIFTKHQLKRRKKLSK